MMQQSDPDHMTPADARGRDGARGAAGATDATDASPMTPAESARAADLARREELCVAAERVVADGDWRQGAGDLRRLQDAWSGLRRWHDPREQALQERFDAAREAFFGARDAHREQVAAAKARLACEAERIATSTAWNETADRLRAIASAWRDLGSSGDRAADDELWRRFEQARATFNERRHDHYAQLDAQRAAAKAAKERLVEEARAAAVTAADWTGDQWRAASNRMRELMDRWKAAGVAGREDNDRLWEAFQAARAPFFEARSAHYDEVDRQHKEAAAKKRALIEKAERLAADADFGGEATELARQLDRDWKLAGSAGKEENDRLWAAFNEAKERFWDARRAYNDERHAQWVQRTKDAIERRRARVATVQEQVDRLQDRLNHALATDHVEEMQDRLDDRRELLESLKAEVAEMERRLERER